MKPQLGPAHPDYGKSLPMGQGNWRKRTGRPIGRPPKGLPPHIKALLRVQQRAGRQS